MSVTDAPDKIGPTDIHDVAAQHRAEIAAEDKLRIDSAHPAIAWERCRRIVYTKPPVLQARALSGISQEETLALVKLVEEGFPVVFMACQLIGEWDKADPQRREKLMRMLTATTMPFLKDGVALQREVVT